MWEKNKGARLYLVPKLPQDCCGKFSEAAVIPGWIAAWTWTKKIDKLLFCFAHKLLSSYEYLIHVAFFSSLRSDSIVTENSGSVESNEPPP